MLVSKRLEWQGEEANLFSFPAAGQAELEK